MTSETSPICPFCALRPIRPRTRGGLPRRDCGNDACKVASRRACERKAQRAYRARLRLEASAARAVVPDVPTRRPHRPVTGIEAVMERNRQARIAARRAGDPRWSVDGWAQRSGRSSLDGECRVVEA